MLLCRKLVGGSVIIFHHSHSYHFVQLLLRSRKSAQKSYRLLAGPPPRAPGRETAAARWAPRPDTLFNARVCRLRRRRRRATLLRCPYAHLWSSPFAVSVSQYRRRWLSFLIFGRMARPASHTMRRVQKRVSRTPTPMVAQCVNNFVRILELIICISRAYRRARPPSVFVSRSHLLFCVFSCSPHSPSSPRLLAPFSMRTRRVRPLGA